MNTAKKKVLGRSPYPPSNTTLFRSYYTHKYWKKQYQNIPATKYTTSHASSLQNVTQTIESQVLPPLLHPRTDTPPPPCFFSFFNFFFFFFFLHFKKFVRLKINILSSIYPEINFPAESAMKINNLSRPKVPAPPPPQDQMVVPLLTWQFLHIHEVYPWNRLGDRVEIPCVYLWIIYLQNDIKMWTISRRFVKLFHVLQKKNRILLILKFNTFHYLGNNKSPSPFLALGAFNSSSVI